MQDLNVFIAHHATLITLTALVLLLIFIIEILRLNRQKTNLSPQQVTQYINRENAVVIDIRPADLYKNGHIIDAYNWSIEELKTNKKRLDKFKSKPLIIVANQPVEAQKVAALLQKQGYNAHSLAGGMRAWTGADMPIVKEST